MVPVWSAAAGVTIYILIFQPVCAAEYQNITVKLGDNAILHCHTDVPIVAFKWTKSGLERPEYVAFYRGQSQDDTHQNLSFKGRVKLAERPLEGNLTLVLINVSKSDEGSYECSIYPNRRRRALGKQAIQNIRLQTTDKQQDNSLTTDLGRSHVGLGVVLGVVLLLLGVVVVVILKNKSISKASPVSRRNRMWLKNPVLTETKKAERLPTIPSALR